MHDLNELRRRSRNFGLSSAPDRGKHGRRVNVSIIWQISGVTVTIGDIAISADFPDLVAAGEFQINFKVLQRSRTCRRQTDYDFGERRFVAVSDQLRSSRCVILPAVPVGLREPRLAKDRKPPGKGP
jgi:hypothetical protein